jgi:hypothetical protein
VDKINDGKNEMVIVYMEVCLLCKQIFTEKRGLKDHYHKKQSCISQKRILDLYKSLHKLVECKIDYSTNENKDKLDLVFEDIKSAISGVQLNPIYSKLQEFGKENNVNIKENLLMIERSGDNALQVYVKTMYCDRKNPENRVIKVTSMNGIFCRVFRDDEWVLECYEKVMIRIAKDFWDLMIESENEQIQDYLLFIYQVVKKRNPQAIRRYITYSKRYILPLLYNETKRDKEFSYLVPNKNKKKAIRKIK